MDMSLVIDNVLHAPLLVQHRSRSALIFIMQVLKSSHGPNPFVGFILYSVYWLLILLVIIGGLLPYQNIQPVKGSLGIHLTGRPQGWVIRALCTSL